MDALTISGIVVFLGCALALYLTRKISTLLARILLGVVMMATAFFTVAHHERKQEEVEKVWYSSAIEWKPDAIPLGVFWERKLFAVHTQTITSAMETWNRRIGCEIFKAASGRVGAEVVVELYDGTQCGYEMLAAIQVAENPDAPAFLFYCGTYVEIQVKRLDAVGLAYRIVLHELGHAIGLDHDTNGAMSAQVANPVVGDYPEFLLPSDKDVKAIKERYCGAK